MRKKDIFVWILAVILPLFAKDIPGSSDHSLLGRIPGSEIIHFKKADFKKLRYPVDYRKYSFKSASLAGRYRYIDYSLPSSVSTEEAVARYAERLTSLGLQIRWQCENADATIIAKLKKVVYNRLPSGSMPKDFFCLSADGEINATQSAAYIEAYNGYKRRHLIVHFVQKKALDTTLKVVTPEKIAQDIDAKGHIALYGIYFDFDSAVLQKRSDKTLEAIAAYLKAHPKVSLYVVGHTDNRGKYGYNVRLSEARANAVVKALVSQYGIDAKRLKAVGIGPVAPIADNESENGRAQNRRVELVKR